MKAIILEDEQLASNRLKRMLKEVAPDIHVVATFETVEETEVFLNKNEEIDLLFLDIHVADGISFDLFELIEIKSKVIFITAYDQYAIEAFRKNAVDYLLKPIKKEQLAEAISRAMPVNPKLLSALPSSFKTRIVIRFLSKLHSIKISEIAYVFSKNKISYFYTTNGDRYPSDYKLQEIEKMLNPDLFFRVNRQFIVHIDAISQIQRHQASRMRIVLLPSIDEKIIISTDKTPIFKGWLDR